MGKWQSIVVAAMLLQACASPAQRGAGPTITLPLFPGWYEGELVYYVTTEISDPGMAAAMNVNYAPRLNDAVPDYPKPPELRTAIERIYKFTNADQAAVLPSIPTPLGATSTDQHYSPLWLVYEVTWLNESEQRVLKSEEEVLAAADREQVTIERTSVLVNCPVVATEDGAVLPGATVNRNE